MKKQKTLIALVIVLAISIVSLIACKPTGGGTLTAPQIELNGNVVSWKAVEHADSYDVTVGSDSPVNVKNTSYTVTKTEAGSYDITVIAKSNDSAYTDSAKSNKVTFTVSPKPTKVTYDDLDLDTANVKLTYFLDEGVTELDLTGLVATAIFSDDSKNQSVAIADLTIGEYDLTVAGNDKEIEVSYTIEGVTQRASLFVTVKERTIDDVNEYQTKTFEYDSSGKYAVDYSKVFDMKGRNLLEEGLITLSEGKTLVNADGNFVVITVARFVSSKEQFLAINDNMDGYYLLTADIDFGGGWYDYGTPRTSSSVIGAVPFNAEEGSDNHKLLDYVNGVGSAQVGIPFNGTIDGQGYALKNLKMHCSEKPQGNFNRGVSVIGYVGEQGTVRNITLRNIYVTAGKYASFLVGYNKGTIENICVEADCSMQTSYSGGTLVAAYNDGKVTDVVSYVSTYIGFNGNEKDFVIANNREIEEESGMNNVLHGTSEGYIADRSDLTAELGDGWRYFDGYGTVLVNEDYAIIGTSERELAIGSKLYLNALFADGDKVNFALYNPSVIDPENGVVKYGWDAEKGSHYLYVNMEADPVISVGSVVKVVIYTTGWKTSQEIEITIVAPVVVENELVVPSIDKVEGMDIDASAVQIKQTYSDGSEQTVSAVKLEGYDKNGTVGVAQTVKAFYGAGEEDYVELTVNLIAKSATGIAVDTASSYKKVYLAGEATELDLTGLKIVVSYNNGSIETVSVTAAMLSDYDLSTAGVKDITISYLEQTCTISITVNAPGVEVNGITVSGTPAKTTYKLGESLTLADLEGITVTAALSDGSEQNVVLSLDMLSYDFATAGSKDITITYEEKTAKITVTVEDYATSLKVTPAETTLAYSKNAPLNLVANATYTLTMASGAESSADAGKVSASDYKPGLNTITYTYEDGGVVLTATQDYEIWYELSAVHKVEKNDSGKDVTLADLSEYFFVQSNLDGYFRMTCDWYFVDETITPIGQHGYATDGDGSTYDPELVGNGAYVQNLTEATPFTGKFDGQGHQIRRFKVGVDSWNVNGFAASLFGYIGQGAVVENIVIRQAEYIGKRIAFIACVNEGTISNVLIESTCSAKQTFGNENCALVCINTASGVIDNVVSYLTKGTNSAGSTNKVPQIVACLENRAGEAAITDFYVVVADGTQDTSIFKGLDGWTIIENVGPAFGNYVIAVPETTAPQGGKATFRIYHGTGFNLDYINIWDVSNPEAYPKKVSDIDGVWLGTVELKIDMTEGQTYTIGLRIDGKYVTYSLTVTAAEQEGL